MRRGNGHHDDGHSDILDVSRQNECLMRRSVLFDAPSSLVEEDCHGNHVDEGKDEEAISRVEVSVGIHPVHKEEW